MKYLDKGKWFALSCLPWMLVSSFTNQAFADSHFSRANCINNESISWSPLLRSFRARVKSRHVNSEDSHFLFSSTAHVGGFRHAAIHWGEGIHPTYPGYPIMAKLWSVIGHHCAWDARSGRMGLWISEAEGCFGVTEHVF